MRGLHGLLFFGLDWRSLPTTTESAKANPTTLNIAAEKQSLCMAGAGNQTADQWWKRPTGGFMMPSSGMTSRCSLNVAFKLPCARYYGGVTTKLGTSLPFLLFLWLIREHVAGHERHLGPRGAGAVHTPSCSLHCRSPKCALTTYTCQIFSDM